MSKNNKEVKDKEASVLKPITDIFKKEEPKRVVTIEIKGDIKIPDAFAAVGKRVALIEDSYSKGKKDYKTKGVSVVEGSSNVYVYKFDTVIDIKKGNYRFEYKGTLPEE